MHTELEGHALDAAVAQLLGDPRIMMWGSDPWIEDDTVAGHGSGGRGFKPSTDWRDGGPILDREPITSGFCGTDARKTSWPDQWYAELDDDTPGDNFHSLGSTRLIAAMRCFVRSKTPRTRQPDSR